ncbi:MAG: SoxR reducing system RseC family protein [Candidatus Aureabacteria bacterium]|nr:SoxR reducing system RseC family protein [Candidatus Auribacterota bacterium]
MREEGVVVSTMGAAACVRMQPQGGCRSCRICVTGSAGERLIEANNEAGAKAGDRVIVEVREGVYLRAAFLVYVLPLIGMCAGYAAGTALWSSERAGFCGGGVGLLIVWAVVRRCDRKIARSGVPVHSIIKILPPGGGIHREGS